MGNGFRAAGRGTWVLALAAVTAAGAPAGAQVPGLPAGAASPAPAKDAPAAKKEKSGETVTPVAGPIKVDNSASKDKKIQEYLERVLRHVPGVREIDCRVDRGVLFLVGRVDSDDTRRQI